jgi:hypothetical protein
VVRDGANARRRATRHEPFGSCASTQYAGAARSGSPRGRAIPSKN